MVTIGSDGFNGNVKKSLSNSDAKMQAKREKLDKENIKAIEKRWSSLPEQERKKLSALKERWPSMSEGEKDNIRARLSERYGGGKRVSK